MINKRLADTDSHKELSTAEKKSETKVQNTHLAFSAFINPFGVEGGLVSLASGRKVQEDVADDLLSVERKGKELFESFRNAVFQNPVIPKPEENGWQRNSVHELEVQWYKDDFIPDELTKIVADDIDSKPEDEEEGDEENYDSDFLVVTSEEEDFVTDDEHI
ncbi:hypothetical protein ElyMa_006588200 [Elysia marginata]|uniref:Uncharacterized protein n=1 Tax=Elysia marginata TaxID=1093978 RepID=A0AAV4IGJ6_9GAST|nr:hypothetical protein ElyMa_006588200 [Elysia marginata]